MASLASLRASTKAGPGGAPGGAVVGRFGVGFAAVRSVADEVAVVTRAGDGAADGVAFSLVRTRGLLAEHGLADRLPDRGDALPVLRLPFPLPADDVARLAAQVGSGALPSPGRATAVVLALRDDDAVAAVRHQLDDLDDALLLALGALDVVRVDAGGEVRALGRDAFSPERGWRVATAHGAVPVALLADRPVEERDRTGWSVTWALPVAESAGTARPAGSGVVHAPTPTADRTTLPGVLVATLPLDATRRHAVEGPLAEHVAREAGELFARTVAEIAREHPDGALALVPRGVPAGWADAVVQGAAVAALRDAPLFDGTPAREAVAIEGPVGVDASVVDALRPALHGLTTLPPSARGAARLLGVSVRPLADVVEDLAPGLPPGGWGRVLAALAPYASDPDVREALASLPVPVVPPADAPGRPVAAAVTVRGARGVVAGDAPDDVLDAFRVWSVPVAHPDAAHPVLHELGALAPDDPAVLELPAVRAALLRAAEEPEAPDNEPDDAARVLAVVAAIRRAHPSVVLPRAAGAVLLPALDGETGEPVAPQAAADLAVPGTWAADVLDLDLLDVDALPPGADPVALLDAAKALGAHDDLDVVTLRDVVLPGPGEDATLPDDLDDLLGDDVLDHLEALADRVGGGTLVDELDVVVPLDAVPDDATAEVVLHVLAEPRLRAALLARPLGEASHLSGWVRARLGAPFTVPAGGRGPHVPFVPGLDETAPDAAGLADVLADPRVAEALGAVRSLDALDDDALGEVLDRVADRDAGDDVPLADAAALWRALRAAAGRGAVWDPPPDRVLALVLDDDGRPRARVVDAADARVASGPHAAVLGSVVPAAPGEVDAVADALDLDVQADDVPPDADGDAAPADGDAGRWRLPAAVVALVPDVTIDAVRHRRLVVAGHSVPWWVTLRASGPGEAGDAVVHATTTDGLARGLALAAGDWSLRHALAAALADPSAADALVVETAWD
ncbi:hypothetical protein GCM10025864_24800 [Luteimicrobium album]|uniref:Molecular chaperone Hsp90 n=1 Tax=Luteimicrobium album TaxID=1054550 RepID=A0ABQ6I379_9MICO|nr:ATP-binding protein [Luteimicrobium album]GMA24721.1 hypothetical protein GCM10025864_24800 [Luteimicrobium album]